MQEQLVILAGGKGKRMNSYIPKPLVKVGGKSIIERLLENVSSLFPAPIIVIGHEGQQLRKKLGDKYSYAIQTEQKGTGNALLAAKTFAEKYDLVLVIPGDHPLVHAETLKELIELQKKTGAVMTLATTKVPGFEGNFKVCERAGRIIRNSDGSVNRIVEFKDATEEEKKIIEVNPSYYCFRSKWLWENIEKIQPNNAAGEYYLTDLLGIATSQGHKVYSVEIKNPFEGMGVNTPEELAIVERYLSSR